jgi:ubiquinone/menaquinone biosynthesis C-methylase UbiE
MDVSPAGFEQIKRGMRDTWMAGDFGKLALLVTRHAEEFVDRLPIRPGMQVLDVACGTGNLAIPAARKGAQVTGVDIATNLLEQARRRASAEGLQVRFDEGDAEDLPYPDGAFDLVMSMFGAMFAPRPERVAAELARVCRPGGTIAMANWAPEGFVAEMFRLTNRYIPPPDGVPSVLLWGDEKVVQQRLGAITSDLKTTSRKLDMQYPFPPDQVVQFFRDYFGPTRVTFSRLEAAEQRAYAADLERMWKEHNQSTDGTTAIHTEYLEVIARRA